MALLSGSVAHTGPLSSTPCIEGGEGVMPICRIHRFTVNLVAPAGTIWVRAGGVEKNCLCLPL